MTRDEAIKIKLDQNDKLIAYGNLSNRVAAEHQIDTWVALGMLKLDEPKSVDDKFKSAVMVNAGLDSLIGKLEFEMIREAIDGAGLKIVEK